MPHRVLVTALTVSALVSVGACAHAQPPRPTPAPAAAVRPTLVVFVTIDQMRGDYFARFGAQFTGGLHRFDAAGAHFTRAYQDHANTETAPGHAATLSGRYPVRTGIAGNSAGVNDADSPLLDAPEMGASPRRFIGTTLLDWMRKADRRTRFLSVSRKDRGAILPIGRARGDVYWYSSTGRFTQSTYYANTLPRWVQEFNRQEPTARYAGWTWTPLLPDSAYAEADSVPVESSGQQFTFPHVIPDEPSLAAGVLLAFPPMDELTLRFALEGVRQLQLGADPTRTDLLSISLSTTDAVGHRFGPDSKELHDQMLRVDRYLGVFLDSLFAVRDSTRVILALTGDHGVTPFPGVRSTVTPNPGARFVDIMPVFDTAFAQLAARGVDMTQLAVNDGALLLGDTTSFRKARISADSVARAIAAQVRAIAGVHRVDMLSDLARADTTQDLLARRWLRIFAPGGEVRFVTTLDRFNYPAGARNAMHGSPWDEDAWVPVMFWGAPFRPGKYDARAHVVDMASTLADVLGIRPLERLDGVVLREALRTPAP